MGPIISDDDFVITITLSDCLWWFVSVIKRVYEKVAITRITGLAMAIANDYLIACNLLIMCHG